MHFNKLQVDLGKMLIEIAFVRYRGFCDIYIYTIGFMHYDFFSVLHHSANKMDGGDN